MRHLNSGRKLNRTSSHRKALFKNMVLALIRHERIKTTDPKAKELRRIADMMVTLGKQGDLAARGRAAMLSVIEFTGNEEQTKSKKPKKRARKQDAETPTRSRAAAAAG